MISQLTGSSSSSEAQENRFGSAYYAAYSGLQYLKYVEKNPNYVYSDLNDFIAKINAGSPYTLPSGIGQFQIVVAPVAGSTTNYTVTTLVGSAISSSASSQESNFLLTYSGQRTFTVKPQSTPNGASEYVVFAGNSDVVISGDSVVIGNLYAKSFASQQANITGSVTTKKDATLGYSTKLSKNLCSGGNVVLDQSSVAGTLNAQGSLRMKYKSSVGSDAFVGTSYTADENVSVNGNLNVGAVSGSDGIFGYQNFYGTNVYVKNNINFSGNEVVVTKNAYAGKTISLSWASKILGVAVGKSVQVGSGTVGSKIETTSYPPNVAPTAPSMCATVADPSPKANLVAGTVDKVSNYGEGKFGKSSPLLPGSYKNLSIAVSEPLTLVAGTYIFNKIDLAYGATLNLNISGGDITIFSIGTVNVGNLDSVNVSIDGATWKSMSTVGNSYAARVYLESHSDINFDWGAEWFGTLFSTGSITLGGNNTLIGAVVMLGANNNYKWDNDITYVPSNYAIANWYQ